MRCVYMKTLVYFKAQKRIDSYFLHALEITHFIVMTNFTAKNAHINQLFITIDFLIKFGVCGLLTI